MPYRPQTSLTHAIFSILIFVCCTSTFGLEVQTPYSFSQKPYLHPKIIQDLSTWSSDKGDQIVAINIIDAMGSNRYFGDVKTEESAQSHPFVFHEDREKCDESTCANPPFFGYRLLGTTPSGVTVLITKSGGGGTGIFESLLLVSFDKDKGFSYDKKADVLRLNRDRLLLKKLSEFPLGDRRIGKISLRGDTIHIGKDASKSSGGLFAQGAAIKVEYGR